MSSTGTKCSKPAGEYCRLHNPAPKITVMSKEEFFDPNFQKKQDILNKKFGDANITFGELKKWFTCTSRPTISDGIYQGSNNKTAEILSCACGQKHPISADYEDSPAYWTQQRQFDILDKYMKAASKGKVTGVDPTMIKQETGFNVDVDLLFKGAKKDYPDIGLNRAELIEWYQCGRKVKHEDIGAAEKHVSRIDEKGELGYQTYVCPFCKKYHVGRKAVTVQKVTNLMRAAHKMYQDYESGGKIRGVPQREKPTP